VKISETSTEYRDTLLQSKPSSTLDATRPNHLTPLAPKLQARESVRARQVLIDLAADQGMGAAAFTREYVASLWNKLNKALLDCDPIGSNFKARAVTHLKNGGIIMELVSDKAML